MSPDRYRRCIEESSKLYSAIKKEVDDGLADNRDGYVAFFFVRRARADGSSVAQGVLAALIINIIWGVAYEAALSFGSGLAGAENVAVLRLTLLALSGMVLVFSIGLVVHLLRENRRAKTHLLIEEELLRDAGEIR